MARGVNKVTLIGNLGNDPELRSTQSGRAVANITLAPSESWRDKETQETKERVEWHRVIFFGRLAEVVNEYLRKGSQVYVEGRIQTRKWQDKDGNDRYTTEIVANEMQMLGSRGTNSDSSAGQQPASTSQPTSPSAVVNDPFDDDIPF